MWIMSPFEIKVKVFVSRRPEDALIAVFDALMTSQLLIKDFACTKGAIEWSVSNQDVGREHILGILIFVVQRSNLNTLPRQTSSNTTARLGRWDYSAFP